MRYFYKGTEYASASEVEAAVLEVKQRLENNPTDWVVVKEVTGSEETGWTIPSDDEALNDSQINNLDDTKLYSVSSILKADTFVGLNASDATSKIAEFRTYHCDFNAVNTVIQTNEYSPTNVDMSVYVSEVNPLDGRL